MGEMGRVREKSTVERVAQLERRLVVGRLRVRHKKEHVEEIMRRTKEEDIEKQVATSAGKEGGGCQGESQERPKG